MTWEVTDVMDVRTRFVHIYDEGLYSMTELCQHFSISRKTGYKWLNRYREGGIPFLSDLSRVPHSSPHQTAARVAAKVIACRKTHPTWGARKLLERLERYDKEGTKFCSPSTATEMIKRAGMVENHKQRRKSEHPGSNPLVAEAANSVWCTDFKGEFLTSDSVYCYPLTITDAHSRYLLTCGGCLSTAHVTAQQWFMKLFHEVGLPEAIRSDNGCPFCSPGLGGLSRLSIWWMKLGIVHQRIDPGKPQQNGQHERMHRVLKAETARPPGRDLRHQQEKFDRWVHEYNHDRPHEAIGMKTPSELWTPSNRKMPTVLPGPEYPGHMEVRTVHKNGAIKFKGKTLFLSETLVKEKIALEEVDDAIWSIRYFNTVLAKLDERKMQIIHPRSKLKPKNEAPVAAGGS